MIDGEHYWDGGVVSNTPITYVADERPLTTARIIQVDIFNSQGELPQNLSQVSERAKDIQYASRTRLNIERIQEFGELRAACRRLVGKLPPALKSDPDAIKLAAACDEQKLDDHSPDQYAPLTLGLRQGLRIFPRDDQRGLGSRSGRRAPFRFRLGQNPACGRPWGSRLPPHRSFATSWARYSEKG